MNFSLISKEPSAFTLVNGLQEIASIKYNVQSHSVRLNSNERRVFFLEQVGILQNKIVLTTEYGVQIGENYYMKHQQKGILHLAKEKFSYTMENGVLTVYDKRQKITTSFQLDKAIALDSYEVSALLFSLAWMLSNAELNAATARKASTLYAS